MVEFSDLDDVPTNYKGEVGMFDREKVTRLVPEAGGRVFGASGPQTMVETYKSILKKLGIKRSGIVTGNFPWF